MRVTTGVVRGWVGWRRRIWRVHAGFLLALYRNLGYKAGESNLNGEKSGGEGGDTGACVYGKFRAVQGSKPEWR